MTCFSKSLAHFLPFVIFIFLFKIGQIIKLFSNFIIYLLLGRLFYWRCYQVNYLIKLSGICRNKTSVKGVFLKWFVDICVMFFSCFVFIFIFLFSLPNTITRYLPLSWTFFPT